MIGKLRTYLTVIAVILSLMGIITFSLFIIEESMQMVVFGTWAAKDAQDWGMIKTGCEVNKRLNSKMRFINNWFGWIQPFAFVSYRSFATSMDYYTAALERQAIAHAPELYLNEEIELNFTPTQVIFANGMYRSRAGLVSIESTTRPSPGLQKVKGTLIKKNNQFILDIK